MRFGSPSLDLRPKPKTCSLCGLPLAVGLLATDATSTWHFHCVGKFLRSVYRGPQSDGGSVV